MIIVMLTVSAVSLAGLYTDFSRQPYAEGKIQPLPPRAVIIALTATFVAAGLIVSAYFRCNRSHGEQAAECNAVLNTIAETAHEAILLVDTQGIIQYVNQCTTTIFGFDTEEMTGKHISIIMPSSQQENDDIYNADMLQTGFRKIAGIGQQLTGQRKDGSHFPIHLRTGEVSLKQTQLFAAVIMDLSTQQKLQREILELPERERQRIGEELHDGLGQQLTGLTMLAESLLNKASRPEHQLAAQLASGLHDALTQVRAMSRGLMPIQIYSDGFIISLQEIAENIEHQSSIPIHLQIDENIQIAEDETATHLYRIVQESLNNAVKHADASSITVSLKQERDHGLLEITDDGIGISPDLENSNGLGLNIMRHRCGMFDGEISINPAGHRGTQIRCRFPINPLKQAAVQEAG